MSVEARRARVHLERAEGFRFTATFPDVPAAPPMTLDEPSPLGGDTGPNPASLLAAAIGDCLAASLVFCLRKARIDSASVEADAVAHILRNDSGRMRIGGIDVSLSVTLTEGDASSAQRCRALFEDYCIVTESVRQGVPVDVSVRITPRALAPSA
jgi:uncharacterized OsmC-like protein